jgi:transposase InsO family protein
VGVLRRRVRKDLGQHRSLRAELRAALRTQHKAHPSWSYQLHADNLAALVREKPAELGPMVSYPSVRRYMKAQGLLRQRRTRVRIGSDGEAQAVKGLERLEVRSFEAEHVHGLWHLDFHHGSRPVATRGGEWVRPLLLGVLDDRSRLTCHLQWYLEETAEALVHGLSQAIQKRALPRALLTDNGSAMEAAETTTGLAELGIVHHTTLPRCPYQNAKQEVFWAQVEGRLLAMLEGCRDLTLELLNQATQAWVELEYNRRVHSELGVAPLERYLEGPDVGRESPSSEELRRAFRIRAGRMQRKSDGTLSLAGRRFEVPSAYAHLERLWIRYVRWDLRSADLVDPRTGMILATIYPLDKAGNSDGRRRRLAPPAGAEVESVAAGERDGSGAGGVAPLLRRLMADYAATGLPPAYLPKGDVGKDDDREQE